MTKLLPVLAVSTLVTIGMNPALAASNISLEQAINIANNRVSGDLMSVDVDFEDDSTYRNINEYELKFVNNTTVYDIEVDAKTGRITDIDEDNLDTDDRTEYGAFKQSNISFAKAMQTASGHINGQVIEADFDLENGRSIYEVNVLRSGQNYEVKIDAKTGSVISSKRD